jgi:hypothetical protein
MKAFQFATGLAVAVLFSSCTSTPLDTRPRFHQAAEADVILRFPSWEVINIVKPDTRDQGFITVHPRKEAEQILARPGLGHSMAVVVLGCINTAEQEADYQRAWTTIFDGLRFKRVVFLRAGWGDKIDGLLVIKEVELGSPTFANRD